MQHSNSDAVILPKTRPKDTILLAVKPTKRPADTPYGPNPTGNKALNIGA